MLNQNKIQIGSIVKMLLSFICSMLFCITLMAQNGINTILLTTPYNEQKLEVKYPLFSWTSTISFRDLSNITYQFKLVEVLPYQSSTSAIISNPALYEKEVGTTTILQYPIDAPELQDCKHYAWQITAYNKTQKIIDEINYKVSYNNKIAQSEPFSFQTNCNQVSRISNPSSSQPYIILAKTVDNYVFKIEANKQLNFKYIEEYADDTLKYKIYNWKRDVIVSNTTITTLIDYGWNYLTIDLSGLNPSVLPVGPQNIYQLEVETPKGDIYKAKFEINKDE